MLGEIVDNFKKKKLRILIEVEPSGKAHFYYDKGNKMFLTREIRNSGFDDIPVLHECTPETTFPVDNIVHLKADKSEIKRKF